MADPNEEMVPLPIVKAMEEAGKQLGTAIHRVWADDMLRKAHNEQERRVEERTAELRDVNDQLKREIEARKRTEEELEKHRKHLEAKVRERTAEQQKTINLMAGREVRMAELKEVIRELRAQVESVGLTPVVGDPLMENSEKLSVISDQ